MSPEPKNMSEKRGITVTIPWHNSRNGVAYRSQARGITVVMAWHNSHGAWHNGRIPRGITDAEAWHNSRIRPCKKRHISTKIPIVMTKPTRAQKSLKLYLKKRKRTSAK